MKSVKSMSVLGRARATFKNMLVLYQSVVDLFFVSHLMGPLLMNSIMWDDGFAVYVSHLSAELSHSLQVSDRR